MARRLLYIFSMGLLSLTAQAADLPGDPSPVSAAKPAASPPVGTGAANTVVVEPIVPRTGDFSGAAAPASAPKGAGSVGVVRGTVVRPAAVPVAPIPDNAGWGNNNAERRAFLERTGFPQGRPGYVIDYIVPLREGGGKTANNMKWVPIEDAGKESQ